MAMKFFMTNITGSIMKELMMEGHVENDDTYFDWMLDQVIRILSTGSGKDIL
jgi:hypothetical protein